jgi:hypothetical protein
MREYSCSYKTSKIILFLLTFPFPSLDQLVLPQVGGDSMELEGIIYFPTIGNNDKQMHGLVRLQHH